MNYDPTDPLAFLMAAMNDATAPLGWRIQAAAAAIPFTHSTASTVTYDASYDPAGSHAEAEMPFTGTKH